MPKELCPDNGAGLRALVLVSSAASHLALREAVRSTWGPQVQRLNMSLAFMLGITPADKHITEVVRSELAAYNDLIIGNFVDAYLNLTLKILSMLEWVDSYCPLVPFLIKSDDDMVLNLPRIKNFLKNSTKTKAVNTMWGKVMKRIKPSYDSGMKYHITKKEYSDYYYPPFISGPMYIMTTDVIPKLVRLARSQNYIWLEDVFFTGILARKLRIRRENVPDMILLPPKRSVVTACQAKNTMAVHLLGKPLHRKLWKVVQGHRGPC